MKILGISAHYHDSAASLIVDGKIVAAVQEERFTRIKHDSSFPQKAIEWCLKSQGLKLSELDAVVYYEKPLLKFDRLLETYIFNAPFGLKQFVQSFPVWIKDKLFLRFGLTKDLRRIDKDFSEQKLFFSEHHLSHAASAFYPSPFEDALVLTLDGVGEWATASVSKGKGAQLEVLQEIHFPHSLGFLYSAITSFCGFKVNSGEYKLMGLAPYGEPRFLQRMRDHMITCHSDGSFDLNMIFFSHVQGDAMFSSEMELLFGVPPRSPESALEPIHMDIAASVQALLEEVLLHMLESVYKQFPHKNLCLAGGVALNCVANSYLLEKGPFENIWVQPAAGDAGGSLGAALALYHLKFQKEREVQASDAMKGAYLGPEFLQSEIESLLQEKQMNYHSFAESEIPVVAASLLAQGFSVGWFQGAMEFGPRALGARSILADPRRPDMQSRLNLQIKFRESFRPFAPMVLEEDVSEWFEFQKPSPYMLFVADVKKERQKHSEDEKNLFGIERLHQLRSDIPAVTHVDYSARLQTVSAERNPCVYPLVKEFKRLTGCSVLVNTSFNVRGEPIVCTPEDALRCFLGTDLDVLVLGSCVLKKSEQKDAARKDYHQEFALD